MNREIIDAPIIKVSQKGAITPLLPVNVFNPHTGKSQNTWAIIDTGADDCAFPADLADLLGHSFNEGEVNIIGTGGGETKARRHTSNIVVMDPRIIYKKEKYDYSVFHVENVLIDFLPNLEVGILGVKNFLENFCLVVDYPAFKFSLLNSAAFHDPKTIR